VGSALNCLAEGVNPVHQVTGSAAGLPFDPLGDACEPAPGEPLFVFSPLCRLG
jgi:hypothetical protein